jgi:hypothetical protein
MKKLSFLILVVFAFAACSKTTIENPAGGLKSVYSSCGQWASYSSGGYTVYNDVWGSGAGSQCLTVNSVSNWYVVSTQPNTSGVKSYANSSYTANKKYTSSCHSSMSTSSPSGYNFEVAWDIWIPGEMMVWINKQGNVGPIGSLKFSNVNVGGATFNVYQGSGVVSFVKTSNTSGMTIDVSALANYCVSKGWASSSGTIGQVQGGFEISGTNNTAKTFTMSSYSVY